MDRGGAARARAGARLLRAALAGMAEAGARAVLLEADPADATAMLFYERFAFAPKGTTALVRPLSPSGTRCAGKG